MRSLLGSTLALLLVLAGCGGKPGEQLFGVGDPNGAGGDGQGGASGPSAGNGASSSVDAAASSSQSAAQSSSSAQSSAQSSVSSSSTGPNPTDVTVYCKNAPCPQGQVCCFHVSDPNLDQCSAPGSCGDNYITLSCNGPEDCPSGECCGDWGGQSYLGVSCVPSCAGDDVLMCEGNPGVCPSGENCFQSQTLGEGYSYCQ
jgi:hypothetical protein